MRRVYSLRKAKRQPSVSDKKPPISASCVSDTRFLDPLERKQTQGTAQSRTGSKKEVRCVDVKLVQRYAFHAQRRENCLPKPWNKALFLKGTTSLHTMLLRLIIPPPPIPAIYRSIPLISDSHARISVESYQSTSDKNRHGRCYTADSSSDREKGNCE